VRILEHQRVIVQTSRSRLAFTTTGGGSWAAWDRFIALDDEPVFHIGNVCGTCEFFFRKVAESTLSSIEIDNLRAGLADGSASFDEVCQRFSEVLPVGEYDAVLFELKPKLIGHDGTADYFRKEARDAWGDDGATPESPAVWPYYRTEPWSMSPGEGCFDFVIPIYDPSETDSAKVAFYQTALMAGASPIAVAVGVLDVKAPGVWPTNGHGDLIEPACSTHWCLANYLLDGHHKMLGASRDFQSIRMLSFISRDHSWNRVDELLAAYQTRGEV
jgi:hypothetical protein